MEPKKSRRALERSRSSRNCTPRKRNSAIERKRAGQVGAAGDAERERRDGHHEQDERADERVEGGGAAGLVVAAEHDEAGLAVLVAVHPRDGEEVRHLPGEEDAEKEPRAGLIGRTQRRPADDRRDGAGDRTDERAKRGAAFHRRVDEDVNGDGRGGEEGAGAIDREQQVERPGDGEREAEQQAAAGARCDRRGWGDGACAP